MTNDLHQNILYKELLQVKNRKMNNPIKIGQNLRYPLTNKYAHFK